MTEGSEMTKSLFEEYPELEGERILLHRMSEEDAEALSELTSNPRVYRYLPSFLYERQKEDKREVIRDMDADCFQTRESILLGIYLRRNPERMIGIAEIYNYEEKKEKASIGCRIDEPYWNLGLATETVGLLRAYLTEEVKLRTVTAHVMRENSASSKAAMKNGFLCKYRDLYGDWGLDEMVLTDKYVYKREWNQMNGSDDRLPDLIVEQFVMAYLVEHDRIRAMLPEGYTSLRPVLRINVEIRSDDVCYLEFNTPVSAKGRRGWLNIRYWKSSSSDDLSYKREGKTVTFTLPELEISFTGTGIEGGCPAEKDNEGCFYIGDDTEFRPAEVIDQNKEFCDCAFAWRFGPEDARGESEGRTIPAFEEPETKQYEPCAFTAENAAKIPCRQVLGSYRVRFRRTRGEAAK